MTGYDIVALSIAGCFLLMVLISIDDRFRL